MVTVSLGRFMLLFKTNPTQIGFGMRRFLVCAISVLCVCALFSCKPGVPSKYLQPDEMADILYDYHLAEGIQAVQASDDSVSMRAYEAYILKKYKVSKADFDTSLVYYTRHTKLLEDVYDQLTERLNNEASAYGGSQIGFSDDFVNSSDTTNLWHASASCILAPYPTFNRKTFEVQADTSYHEGDKIMLDFDTQFIYQDGVRDAIAVLAVTYANDSVEVVSNSLMSSSHYHLQINNIGRLKIKNIKGFWLHNNGQNQTLTSRTTLRMLLLTNIKLVRMHTKPTEEPEVSEKVGSTVDSVKRNDKDSSALKKQMVQVKFVNKKIKTRANE